MHHDAYNPENIGNIVELLVDPYWQEEGYDIVRAAVKSGIPFSEVAEFLVSYNTDALILRTHSNVIFQTIVPLPPNPGLRHYV